MKILSQGAEAKIYQTNGSIVKERIQKRYRVEAIDTKLRKKRTKSEAKIMQKLGDLAPNVLQTEHYKITMEKINGQPIRNIIEQNPDVAKKVGQAVTKMHDKNIAHGDLTTSNMIYDGDQVRLIDFGLSTMNARIEDKAVDLHVLKSIIESTHKSNADEIWAAFQQGYTPKERDKIMERYQKVRQRGRYK